jgi:hypothetical protein
MAEKARRKIYAPAIREVASALMPGQPRTGRSRHRLGELAGNRAL